MSLTRALMKFGSPTHRLQAHVEQSGKRIGLNVTCVYLATATFVHIEQPDGTADELCFAREFSGLDLDKSLETHKVSLKVYRGEWSPNVGQRQLKVLLKQNPRYNWWQRSIFQGLCSAAICSGGFSGSFIDSMVAFPFGFIVSALSYIPSSGNELYMNIYE